MSAAMLDLEERPQVRTRPPASWRNWYRVYRRMWATARVGEWAPGLTPGPDLFPSKEIAEQHALEFVEMKALIAAHCFDYIGAYPEHERPPS